MNKVLLLFFSFFIINASYATVYYSQVSVGGGRDVTQLSNWSTIVGGGTNPTSFVSGDEFHIVSSDSMMASSGLNMPGAKLVIENGKFNSSGFSHNFTLDMLSSGYYYHTAGSYINVLFGSLNASSGFEFRSGNFIASRTYPNLIFNATGNVPINGNPIILGSLSSVGSGQLIFAYTAPSSITISNDFNILKGQFTGVYGNYNCTVSVGGNFNLAKGIANFSRGSGTFIMNVSGGFNVSSGSLYLSMNSGVTGPVSVSVSGNLNMTGGTYIGVSNGSLANPILTIGGNCSIQNSYYAQNGTATVGIPTYILNGSGTLSMVVPINYNHNLTVSGTYSMGSNIQVGKDLLINGGSLSIGSRTLSLYNNLTVNSGFLLGGTSSNLSILSPSSLDLNLPSITLNSLLVNRTGQTVSMTGDVAVGNLNLTAGTLAIGSHTLTCLNSNSGTGTLLGGSSSNLIISGTSYFNLQSITLNNLTMDRVSQNLKLNGSVNVLGVLSIINGNIDNSQQPLIIGNRATILRDNGVLIIPPTFSGHYNLSYSGTSGVTPGNELYSTSPNIIDSLTVSKTGGVTLNNNIEVNKCINITTGGVLLAYIYTIVNDGNWINNGTFRYGQGTVIFNANSTVSGTPVGGHSFYNISISANATLTAPNSTNVNVFNNFITNSTSVFNHNNGTFTFASSGSQTIPSINFYNLSSTSSGTRTLSSTGTIGIGGTLSLGINNYNTSGSTINFNGTSAQNIPTFTFNNLTVSGGTIKTLNSGNITIGGTLLFSNSIIATGTNKVIISSTGSVIGGGSGNYVFGNLQKNFATGSSVVRTFEIGNASNYLPVIVTFPTVSTAGNVTANTTDNDHPQIASSCLDANKSVNRFWTLTNSGVSPSNYNVVLNFVSGDVDGGANYANFEGQVYNGSNWQNLTSGTKTTTSIVLSGATIFGDLQIGETSYPVSVSISANPGTAICPNTSVTFSASPVNGGISPVYSWTKNGLPVGTNSNTYVDNTLSFGDVIQVNMVSNSSCAFQPNATSNSLTITNSGGCSYTWTGALSSVWSTAGNWSSTITPDSTDDITIPSGTPNNPAVTGSVKVRNVTINSGATLTLNSSSTFQIFGDFINNGTFTDAGATTIFSGTAAQSITGASTFSNLTLNNGSGLTLNNNVDVLNILRLLNGTLTTNGFLTVDLNTGNIAYNATDNGSILGNLLVMKTVNSTNTHYLGCPLNGVTANDFNDDTPVINSSTHKTRLFTFDPNTQAYVGISNLNTPLTEMTGYSLFFTSPAPKVLDFTGTYSHGATYSAITCPNTAHNSILVGNPYPSTLDWTIASGWSKTGISDGIYFWDAPNLRYASYVNGSSVNGGTPYVPALQGFFVFTDSTSGGTASIAINNNARTTSQTPALWRKGVAENTLNIRLSGGKFSDESLIRFDNEATDQFDRSLDAFKIINPDSTPSVYTCDSRNIYSINTMSKGEKVIPLNVKAGFSGLYTLSLVNSGFDFATNLILEDKVLNTKKKLSSNDQYVFTINNGDRADRFTLYINNSSNNGALNSKVLIGSYDKTVNLTFNNGGNTADIKIYNIVGQEVESIENADISSGIYSYSNSELKEGIYVVKVILGNEFYTGKVYIK